MECKHLGNEGTCKKKSDTEVTEYCTKDHCLLEDNIDLRFSEEEREALKEVSSLAYNYVKGFDNGRSTLVKGHSKFGEKKLSAIATVRKMLEVEIKKGGEQ